VSGFSAEWLTLREPFDAAARAAALVTELATHLTRTPADAPLEIVDLGAGAGSNLRYLAPRLGGHQHWWLVDHDADLLATAVAAVRAWAQSREVVTESADALAVRSADGDWRIRCERRDLAEPRAAPLTDLELPSSGLVTAAALLDLVSESWLAALITRCRNAGAAVCFALSYDGRTACIPAEPEDAEVLELFNRHQRLDKGFGAPLGPDAARVAERQLRAHGYHVTARRSDWIIGPQHVAMQCALLDGWLGAALEIAPQKRRGALADWHRRRSAHVAAGGSTLQVGHVDLVGWL
jgi:hypothetical protein